MPRNELGAARADRMTGTMTVSVSSDPATASMTDVRRKPSGKGLARLGPLISALGFVILIALWEVSTRAFGVPDYILPPPSQIAVSLYNGIASGLLIYHFSVTAFQTLSAFFIAATLGITIGTLVTQFKILELG